MRRVTLCLLMTVLAYVSNAQQQQTWSSFYETGFVYNPALTAPWNTWEATAVVRRQWTNFENAPESGNVSFQYPVVRRQTKLCFGGYIDYDRVGPYTRGTIAGTMAYKMRTRWFGNRDDVLSLGGKVSIEQYRFDATRLTAFDGVLGDRNLQTVDESSVTPNISLGAYYVSVSDFYSFKSHYYFGFAANNLVPASVTVTNAGNITNTAHANIHAGYRHFPRRSPYYIEPNIFVSYAYQQAVMANIRYEKVNSYWLSAGAVSNGQFFGQVGFIFNDRSFLGPLVKDGILRIGTKVDYQVAGIGEFAGIGYEAYIAYVFENEPY